MNDLAGIATPFLLGIIAVMFHRDSQRLYRLVEKLHERFDKHVEKHP